MGSSILGEIGEYVGKLVELFKSSPPDVVAVVISGSAILGFAAALVWKKLTAKIIRPDEHVAPASATNCEKEKEEIKGLQAKLAKYSKIGRAHV